MKKTMLILAACLIGGLSSASADNLKIDSFRHAGPYAVAKPFFVDQVNIAGQTYDAAAAALDSHLSIDNVRDADYTATLAFEEGLHLAGFSVQTVSYAKTTLKIEGLDHYRLFMDGKPASAGELRLEPGTHDFVIKYLADGKTADVNVSFESAKDGLLSVRKDGRRIYSLDINSMGIECNSVGISASGKYISVISNTTLDGGSLVYETLVMDSSDGRILVRDRGGINWMPSRDEYWQTQKTEKGTNLVCINPETKALTVLAENIPDGYFEIAPTEDYLIYSMTQEGPSEGSVHQIIVPDDRQPGWRDRSYLAIYDLETGLMRNLTYGWHNAWLSDISDDGAKLLIQTQGANLESWPTSLSSLYIMDVRSGETRCIVENDGFIGGASFSPDASQVLLTGSAEALGGIGKDLPEGRIANTTENQLFVLNIADGKISPITMKFNPSVAQAEWSRYDGKIYLRAENKDCIDLFRINPKNAKSEKLDNKEEDISSFALARKGPGLIYFGQSLCNGHRVYTMDTKKGSQKLVRDFSAERLAGVDICEGRAYEFTNSLGEKVNGFYVLPAGFDPAKKYPMIVFYYGGCSPTTRYMVGLYSPHMYAAQGYVFLVINPSGASGFGQEWASRHVNTAGDRVADDIIEGVKSFCKDHKFVNADKIGCIGASYGGFMTQLLLTKTDIFATGISHAGISDHTSYWGEGYWGYSYSEVSMAKSYPWTRKDLYVDRSPLYNADKINSPLLFLHGGADTNVPIGESIQMFTALKLLGKETAFVTVDGENHRIMEYSKRRQWLRTIFAWFSMQLKDDDTWWNDLYAPKNL